MFSALQIKRQVFVSYHHANDQAYYDAFSRTLSDRYGALRDDSLERKIDSNNSEYVMRKIREDYITGTSCTFVLCGRETPNRKFVDWEIKATLDKGHGLIGIALPTCQIGNGGAYIVPDRLHENVQSGYAVWTTWNQLHPTVVTQLIELANSRSSLLIKSSAPLMSRNR